jgi:tRNA(Ile)-lysidine synthase
VLGSHPHSLDCEEFTQLVEQLSEFPAHCHVAIALSGGRDSLALTLLVSQWALKKGYQVTALTVDHGLRENSGDEAKAVAQMMKEWSIPHVILPWQGDKPQANIQATARQARYRLLLDWCRSHDVHSLFVGHHLEDQAETFLLRLARGSGVDGLSAMISCQNQGYVNILRPFLTISRQRIEKFLKDKNIVWIEDPSNQSRQFSRIRLRQLQNQMEKEGFTSLRLAQTAHRMRRVRQALEHIVTEIIKNNVQVYSEGYCLFKKNILRDNPEEIGLRVIALLLKMMGDTVYRPRLERLERLYETLIHSSDCEHTLSGCKISSQSDSITICRETGRITERLVIRDSEPFWWDSRYFCSVESSYPLSIFALQDKGVIDLKKLKISIPFSFDIATSLPTFYHNDEIVAVPHLHYNHPEKKIIIHKIDFKPHFSAFGDDDSLVIPVKDIMF